MLIAHRAFLGRENAEKTAVVTKEHARARTPPRAATLGAAKVTLSRIARRTRDGCRPRFREGTLHSAIRYRRVRARGVASLPLCEEGCDGTCDGHPGARRGGGLLDLALVGRGESCGGLPPLGQHGGRRPRARRPPSLRRPRRDFVSQVALQHIHGVHHERLPPCRCGAAGAVRPLHLLRSLILRWQQKSAQRLLELGVPLLEHLHDPFLHLVHDRSPFSQDVLTLLPSQGAVEQLLFTRRHHGVVHRQRQRRVMLGLLPESRLHAAPSPVPYPRVLNELSGLHPGGARGGARRGIRMCHEHVDCVRLRRCPGASATRADDPDLRRCHHHLRAGHRRTLVRAHSILPRRVRRRCLGPRARGDASHPGGHQFRELIEPAAHRRHALCQLRHA
eukprot:31119-Pelagococcus_subviridis.AAC.4